MDLEQFRLDVADGIATVTFDRAPVNAQNRRTREELIYVFDTISDRDDVRVAILTGTGTMFSAGADLKERVDMVHEPGDYVRHNRLVREFFYERAQDEVRRHTDSAAEETDRQIDEVIRALREAVR